MDRLGWAFIGGMIGALVGGACWLLFGLGLSARIWGRGVDPNPLHWIAAVGIGFAVLGFLFKNKVGSLLGDFLAALVNNVAGNPSDEIGWRGVVILMLLGALAIWYFAMR